MYSLAARPGKTWGYWGRQAIHKFASGQLRCFLTDGEYVNRSILLVQSKLTNWINLFYGLLITEIARTCIDLIFFCMLVPVIDLHSCPFNVGHMTSMAVH